MDQIELYGQQMVLRNCRRVVLTKKELAIQIKSSSIGASTYIQQNLASGKDITDGPH
jgi:hypothetical protein